MKKLFNQIIIAILFWFGYEPPPESAPALQKNPPSGVAFMAAGAFFFSVMSLLVKIAGERLPSQEIVLARAVVTVVLSYVVLRRMNTPIWGRQPLWLIARGLIGFVGLSGFYYAVIKLPLADATVIQYTNPVFAGLMAVPILKERLRLSDAIALIGSLSGVIIMMQPSFLFPQAQNHLPPTAVGVGLIAAIASGAAYVLIRKLRAGEAPMVVVFYFALVSTLLSLPSLFFACVMPTAREWLVLLALGLSTQLGQVSITRGLASEKAGRASAVGYLQIVFSAVWSIIFFSDVPDAGTICGAVLIIGSTLFLMKLSKKN